VPNKRYIKSYDPENDYFAKKIDDFEKYIERDVEIDSKYFVVDSDSEISSHSEKPSYDDLDEKLKSLLDFYGK